MKVILSARVFKQIERAVRRLCPLIEQQINANSSPARTECQLRRELVACILGSQVRHEMATTALEHLEQAQLLQDDLWSGPQDSFESRVFDVLSGHTPNLQRKWSYRFPKIRSQQLAKARDAIAEKSLTKRLSTFSDPKNNRKQLVKDISGIGPKQASMFLRNIGWCYNLAILDTHVLRYMDLKKLLCLKKTEINTVKGYEHTESVVVNYAKELGYPAGYMDWAIWATMRAASELGI